MSDVYETAEAGGNGWDAWLGDSCERMSELADDSIDLSVFSLPFSQLFVYSATPRDLNNCSTREEFLEHYLFIARELYRVTKPGRNACVHAADLPTTKAVHGASGLYDFPGDVIRCMIQAGWVFYGRWWVDRDPQLVAIKNKVSHLMFTTKNRDSARSAPCVGDQKLLFRKPGINAIPVPHDALGAPGNPANVNNDEWIRWARPVWSEFDETEVGTGVWLDVDLTKTLNAGLAKEIDGDERHMHPLALPFIRRCVRLWSNPGELVADPFGGVCSTPYVAVELGRRGWSCELKRSYWELGVGNMRSLEAALAAPSLFDDAAV